MNIFKRLFIWTQSAPVDFCYVTGEWSFNSKHSAKLALSSNAFQSANGRSSVALPGPVVLVAAARVTLPATTRIPATIAAHG
jgi:hypothetical protein